MIRHRRKSQRRPRLRSSSASLTYAHLIGRNHEQSETGDLAPRRRDRYRVPLPAPAHRHAGCYAYQRYGHHDRRYASISSPLSERRSYYLRANAAFGFTRTLSGTIGISIGNAIYSSELRRRLPKIPGVDSFTAGRSVQQLSNDVGGLTKIEVRHRFFVLYPRSHLHSRSAFDAEAAAECYDEPTD